MDKRQQYALIQRRKGELAKALREGLNRFTQLGIKADVYVPKGKDNVAYLLIDEDDLTKFFQRRTVSKMRKLGKDINRVKGELNKMKIRSEVFVDVKDYVNLTFLMDVNSIVEYFDRQVKKTIESKRVKVLTTVYRENNVLVVRFAK